MMSISPTLQTKSCIQHSCENTSIVAESELEVGSCSLSSLYGSIALVAHQFRGCTRVDTGQLSWPTEASWGRLEPLVGMVSAFLWEDGVSDSFKLRII